MTSNRVSTLAGKAGKAGKTPFLKKWAGKAGKRYLFQGQGAGKAGKQNLSRFYKVAYVQSIIDCFDNYFLGDVLFQYCIILYISISILVFQKC